MSKSILVIAAHPDDEILGCGGTMARYADEGDSVYVVILAEGITSRDLTRNREKRKSDLTELAESARSANDVLGVKRTILDNFPDNRMDSCDRLDIVKAVEGYIERFKPDILFTHHIGDVNIDHRRIHEAVVTACRPMPGTHSPDTVLFFEVQSSTEWQPPGSAPPFVPDWFVEISGTLERKLKALDLYKSEMRPWPHARSLKAVEHQARWRGSNIGVDAAEAFMLGRKLVL